MVTYFSEFGRIQCLGLREVDVWTLLIFMRICVRIIPTLFCLQVAKYVVL